AAVLVGEGKLVTFFTPVDASQEEGGEKVDDGEFKILDAQREVVEGIYEALDSEVPSYAVPTSIIPISALPLTAGGDVDTSSLARSYSTLTPPQLAQYANPSASTAAQITVVGGDKTDDSLFGLGN
ncbi:hypothetical protein V498_09948, partial [Pseudogymnoascus sp. VKM F-4517 (FW-2822)]